MLESAGRQQKVILIPEFAEFSNRFRLASVMYQLARLIPTESTAERGKKAISDGA